MKLLMKLRRIQHELPGWRFMTIPMVLGLASLLAACGGGSESIADTKNISSKDGYLIFASDKDLTDAKVDSAQQQGVAQLREQQFPGFVSMQTDFERASQELVKLDAELSSMADQVAADRLEPERTAAVMAAHKNSAFFKVMEGGEKFLRENITDQKLLALVNRDGLIQVGNTLYHHSATAIKSAPANTSPQLLIQAQASDAALGIEVRAVKAPTFATPNSTVDTSKACPMDAGIAQSFSVTKGGKCGGPDEGGSSGGGSPSNPYTTISCASEDGCKDIGALAEGDSNIYTVSIAPNHDVDLFGGITMKFAIDGRKDNRYEIDKTVFSNGVAWVNSNMLEIKVPKNVYKFTVKISARANDTMHDSRSVALTIDDGRLDIALWDTTKPAGVAYTNIFWNEIQQQTGTTKGSLKIVFTEEGWVRMLKEWDPNSQIMRDKFQIRYKIQARKYQLAKSGWVPSWVSLNVAGTYKFQHFERSFSFADNVSWYEFEDDQMIDEYFPAYPKLYGEWRTRVWDGERGFAVDYGGKKLF